VDTYGTSRCAVGATAAIEPLAGASTEVIPAVVTGRAIVYEWKCTNGVPEIMRQFAQPDAQGFLSHIWYAVSPD
jgi:hypothetical protein